VPPSERKVTRKRSAAAEAGRASTKLIIFALAVVFALTMWFALSRAQ
jgi:hypothetical protein